MNTSLILTLLLSLPAVVDEAPVFATRLLLEDDGVPADPSVAETEIDSFPFIGGTDPGVDQDKDRDRDRDREGRDSKDVIFTIGPAAGYLNVRDADRGTWFGGVQARVQFLRYLGVEGSVTFHQNRFADGDIVVTQYPVQVTGLVFPFPDSGISPYALGGAGWYYTRVDYDSSLGGGDETDRMFGWHAGAGAQIMLGRHVGAFGDFRWIFLDDPGVDNSNLDEEEFDYWQVTLGVNFGF